MRRYFFHIHNGNGFTRDEEGRELRSLAAARLEALTGIRSLIGEELRQGTIDLRGRLEICDAQGSLLLSVHFTEAIAFKLPVRGSE